MLLWLLGYMLPDAVECCVVFAVARMCDAEFGAWKEDYTFVTDNGSNIVAGFCNQTRLDCAAHNLNLVLKNVFNKLDEDNPVLNDVDTLVKEAKIKRAGLGQEAPGPLGLIPPGRGRQGLEHLKVGFGSILCRHFGGPHQPGVRSRRSSRPLRYSRQGLAQEIQHLRQLGGIHFDVHCFQGAVPVNPTSDTTCERVPAEGAVPRGLLISNDNTAPRENTRSGKQQMRAHLQLFPSASAPVTFQRADLREQQNVNL
ncbi:UNVERIFIED_CONTAM: hypothetical protein FKN15_020334 [Acipenser sinensis]